MVRRIPPSFCVEPKPWGLGYDSHDIDAIIDERKTAQARASDTLPLAMHGEVGNGRSRPSMRRSTYGETADYLTARIARDRPDILERMKAGEFKSVRAAAKEGSVYVHQSVGKWA